MPPPSFIQRKAELRCAMRDRLKAASTAALAEWSTQLVERLQENELWRAPGTVALFGGLRSEPDLLAEFAPRLRECGWQTVLFAVSGTDLLAYEVAGAQDLRRSSMGVWEPIQDPTKAVPLSALTVILVPALAFAEKGGGRLGRGGGFYDRLLSREDLSARRIGVAFELQIVPELPLESHDACVPEFVTELRWQRVPPSRAVTP